MRLRVLLALLFTFWVALLSLVTYFVALALWNYFAPFLPDVLYISSWTEPTYVLFFQIFAALLLFIILLMSFLYLLLDRIIITPIKVIAQAFKYFAEHTAQMPLPAFSRSTIEIKALADAFQDFTVGVEMAHTHDMEVSRVKSDFISTAAHQFRTPLTGIRWALEALQMEQLTESQAALVKSAVDKSHDLVAVVGTLLDISSIESGKYKYVFAPTDIDPMINQVVNDFVPLSQQSKVNLLYERGATALPTVSTDRERIKWILNNLIENAIRYTPAEGSVRVSTEVTSTQLIIRVRDTGIGIPQADRENIFERFYRAGNAISKENKGNGLGLYIARTIATDHGGDLTFSANAGGAGTTFSLSLPLMQNAL